MNDEEYNEYIDELRLHGTRELAEEVYKLEKEIERLNNIINLLEQEMNEELKNETSGEDFWCGYDACLKDFLQRLKELKGSDISER